MHSLVCVCVCVCVCARTVYIFCCMRTVFFSEPEPEQQVSSEIWISDSVMGSQSMWRTAAPFRGGKSDGMDEAAAGVGSGRVQIMNSRPGRLLHVSPSQAPLGD